MMKHKPKCIHLNGALGSGNGMTLFAPNPNHVPQSSLLPSGQGGKARRLQGYPDTHLTCEGAQKEPGTSQLQSADECA